MSSQFTRRAFLKMAGAVAGLSIMAACAPKVIKETVIVEKPVERVVEKEKEVTKIVEKEKEVTKVVEKQKVVTATPAPQRKATLRYFGMGQWPETAGGGTEWYLKLFYELHPNITIEPVQSADYNAERQAILGLFAAGDPPELFNTSDVRFNVDREIAVVQHLQLDEYFQRDAAEYQWDDIYPTITKYMKMFDGHYYYGCNWANSNVMAYNMKLFDEAKVPYPTKDWTWDDMVMAGKELTKFDKDGNFVQVGKKTEGWWWGEYYYYQRQAGLQDWLSDDGKTVYLDTPEAIAGMQFYYDCVYKHKISDIPPKGLPNGFAGGFYAMHNFIHTGNFPGYSAAGLQWDIMVPPAGKRREGGELALNSVGIGKGNKYVEECWAFIKFDTGPGIGGRQNVKMGLPPTRKSIAQETWLVHKDAPEFPAHPERFFDAMPYNMITLAPPGSWDIWGVLQKKVELFWENKITPEEACKQAAEEFRKVIASGGKTG